MSGHPYAGHKENAVGHRRVKAIMRANGGGVSPSAAKPAKRAFGGALPEQPTINIVSGYKAGGRIDKRARGGGIRKITPSKHKPHININVINKGKSRLAPKGPMLPGPAAAPLPDVGAAPGPLAINPGAVPGMPPMRAKGGKIGKARVGKMGAGDQAGQGSGAGRLEEFKRMKRSYP